MAVLLSVGEIKMNQQFSTDDDHSYFDELHVINDRDLGDYQPGSSFVDRDPSTSKIV